MLVDTYWQATDAATLESAVSALPDGYTAAPRRSMATAAGPVWCALVRGPEQAAPPAGVVVDTLGASRAVVGVFAAGPDARVDPRAWMERIAPAKQRAIAAAALGNPDVMLMLLRMAAGPVNPEAEETRASVASMAAAGLIDAEDARALLFPGA